MKKEDQKPSSAQLSRGLKGKTADPQTPKGNAVKLGLPKCIFLLPSALADGIMHIEILALAINSFVAKAVLECIFNPSAKADGNKLLDLTTLFEGDGKGKHQ